MEVRIKDFRIDLEIKNSGLELEVRDPDGAFRGDCYVTKTGLTWCEGKTTRKHGKKVTWNEFIEWVSK